MKKRITSPCVDVCQLRKGDNVCRGCYRTLDEIGRWSTMPERERLSIMDELPARKATQTV